MTTSATQQLELTARVKVYNAKLKVYTSKLSVRLLIVLITLVVMITILGNLFVIFGLERWFDEFLEGISATLNLYVFALIFGFILGLILAIGRVYGGRIISRVATGYIEVIRGTPIVTQILILAFLPDSINVFLSAQELPLIPLSWELRHLMSSLCLGMNSAAYQAEFFRGSITSVSAGQMLAAQAIGMSRRQAIIRIILPQSMRRVIPAWSNEASYLPKVTTAVYFVGIPDIFHWATVTSSRTFLPLIVYSLVAFFFIILISLITWILDTVYDEIKIPGL